MDEQADRLRALADENERLHARLRRARALGTVGCLAGGVTHELNNLLMTIGGNAERILSDLETSDPQWKPAGTIVRATERAAWLTRQLLRLGHQEPQPPSAFDLEPLLARQVKLLRRLAGAGVQVAIPPPGSGLWAEADEALVEHLLLRVAAFAADALPGGGTVSIEASRDEDALPPRIRVVARLEGGAAGVAAGAPEAVAFLLENVAGHEAPLGVEARPDGSLAVELLLPAARAAAPAPPGDPAADRASARGTVLRVDADDDAREALAAAVGARGYRPLEARNAGEALLLAEREPVHLLVSEIVLPLLGGVALFDRLARHQPGLAAVFITNGVGGAGREEASARGAALLAKPFPAAALLAAIRDALA